ncbi:DUF7003 family protein [Kitasatospora sp. NPDC054939]
MLVRGTAPAVDAGSGTPLAEVFRRLVPEHRALLLADEAELRSRIPADLPVLLRLDAWHQPDDFAETPPSEHEGFRMIAEVLDSGDPTRYRPTVPANTHWPHWPEAGTL